MLKLKCFWPFLFPSAIQGGSSIIGDLFGACAWVYINQKIFNEFRHNRLIQIPTQRSEHSMIVRKTREKLEQKLKRGTFPEEIAEAAGLPVQDVTIVLENEAFPVSIFQGCNENGTPLIDILHDKISNEPELQSFELWERLKKLTRKERFIIYSYLWKEETLEEIGRKLGTNRESIRLIFLKALKKLKKNGFFILKTDKV